MTDLPEELLDQIIANVNTCQAPTLTRPESRTIYSLCLTSRKFYRIAKPYLYKWIHSTSGTMGRAIFRTLSANPDLARTVDHLAVQHTNQGCYLIEEASFHDLNRYGDVKDECATILFLTLRLLPNLTSLDLIRFTGRKNPVDMWLTPLLELMNQASDLFSRLRHFAVHLSGIRVHEILSFLRLPSLRSLAVDVRGQNPVIPTSVVPESCVCGVESLFIVGLHENRVSDVEWLASACPMLRGLSVATTSLENTNLISGLLSRNLGKWSLDNVQFAVVGLWYYDTALVKANYAPEIEACRVYDALVDATGRYGSGDEVIEILDDTSIVRSVRIRELTNEEKQAYDDRLARRP